jgi:thiol-disulfide isomerase/thioredoxin
MKARWAFGAAAVLAVLAGTALWLGGASSRRLKEPSQIAPAALFGAAFADSRGEPVSLGRYQGKVLVVNFWATWCAPCREEMPAFARLQSRWGDKGVQFIGISNEEGGKVRAFGRDLGVNYPLWVGGDAAGDLARRLGNVRGFLPFTALVDRQGRVLETRVGPYTEVSLDKILSAITAK